MRHWLLSLVFLITGFFSFSQNTGIGVGTTNPHPSAAFEIKDSARGFLPPRITTAQRNNIQQPAEGLMIYNTSTQCAEIFVNGYWQQMYCAQPVIKLDSGLIGYWPFSGNANDESGSGNNGAVNGATLTNDRFGNPNKAYNFNGINNYILVGNIPAYNFNNFSISFWFSTNSNQPQVAFTQLKYQDASSERFSVFFNEAIQNGVTSLVKFNNPYCLAGNGWIRNEKNAAVFDGQYHHFLTTINGGVVDLYLDGILLNSLNTGYSQSSLCFGGDLQIGRAWLNYPWFFNGKIDDIRLYNRPLAQAEITYLATH